MPIVRSIIRHSCRSAFCFGPLIFLFIAAFCVLLCNFDIVTQINIRDISSLCLLCFGIVTIILFSSFIHLLLLFAVEYFLSGRNSDVLSKLWMHLTGHDTLMLILVIDFILMVLCQFMELKFNWGYLKVIISVSILCACVIMWHDYDDVELFSCQNMEQSIGACWAHGAFTTFYSKIVTDITKRMAQFENKHQVTLLVKKLVIICPLSCNANGSLEGKDGNIESIGHLEDIIEDVGANNNRVYRTNVYKIHGPSDSYIAAEIPSPLSTLYAMRDVMDNIILQYHRKCFIESLRELLKSEQCIILEYDDINSTEPLHRFLLSKLG